MQVTGKLDKEENLIFNVKNIVDLFKLVVVYLKQTSGFVLMCLVYGSNFDEKLRSILAFSTNQGVTKSCSRKRKFLGVFFCVCLLEWEWMESEW